MKEYKVPFKVEGDFILKAKNISDLKKKMDGMYMNDLMATSANISLEAYPDRAEMLREINDKIKIKTITK